MAIDLVQFKRFCDQLTQIDFFGEGQFRPGWKYPPTSEAVVQAIEAGAADLPSAYRNGYVSPLIANMQHVLLQTSGRLEPYAGVIYQYAEGSPVAEPLHRFLAVISDFYRSFLDKTKRAGLNVPLVTQLPPLALFESASGGTGPYTIPSDDMWNLTGSDIGLVSNATPALAAMRKTARRVGAYIAKTPLKVLGSNPVEKIEISIQNIETWDDEDDEKATRIADALKEQKRVDSLGDDAQLLAGANMAVVERPDLYQPMTRLLELALDRSFREDPIWRPSRLPPPSSALSAPRRPMAPGRLHRRNP
jgi:hypothetical protein